MTFVCLGLTSDGLSGQPMEACHARDVVDPATTSNGQRILGTFAFIASPGRNELAVADMDKGRLLDLTPYAPGYGMLPVGGNPEAIASTQDGCWVATANRTSCDFSLVDPARLLTASTATFSSAVPATHAGDVSRRISIKGLHSIPGEIAFLPSLATSSCSASAPPRAVVTFPTCDLVALLEFSFENASASIVNAFYIRPDLPGGFAAAGNAPVCPSDCGAVSEADGGASLGTEAVDAGGANDAGVDGGTSGQDTAWHLQPLALLPDGSRVYVGSLFDTAIVSLDISAAGLLEHPVRFSLAENPVGVSRLRLGIDPYRAATAVNADGPKGGQFLRNRGKFLYAFTRDDSIRVVKLADPQEDVNQATPVECDVNIIAKSDQEKIQGCLPVGTANRRPLAKGPGIRIPTFSNPDSPPPLPRDIAFADLQPQANNTNYHSLSGQFGFVVASNGYVYVLNVAPSGEDATSVDSGGTILVEATATHSFREQRDDGDRVRTPLEISTAPQRESAISDQSFPTTASFSASYGPHLLSFSSGSSGNGTTTNWLDFPDPDYIISRTWDVVWEGTLPQTSRESGIVQAASADAPAGVLSDTGANFCTSGAQPGDILMFSGCTQNSECQPDDIYSCQPAVSGARGMCLPKDTAASSAITNNNNCSRFLGSRMRYEIVQAKPTSLGLQLKLDEVPKTSLNPCKQDSDCRPDVDHGKLAGATPDSGINPGFVCLQVYGKDQNPRCVKTCEHDTDCRTGHVCEAIIPGSSVDKVMLCVEAPPITSDMLACFPQPMTSYSVRAGHSFMVNGSSLPSISTARVSNGICEPIPATDPSLVARIPLSAPACPQNGFFPAQDSTTFVQQLSAQSGSNPCLYQSSQHDGAEAGSANIRAFFQNPQIRFVITNLEDYAGDLLTIHFVLQYGFIPLYVTYSSYEVLVTMGTRIITGPTKTPESLIRQNPIEDYSSYPYLYVVDQGRTASTSGSHGQVLRINPRYSSNERASFDATLSGSTPFQLQ
jgi:hypothetical protein